MNKAIETRRHFVQLIGLANQSGECIAFAIAHFVGMSVESTPVGQYTFTLMLSGGHLRKLVFNTKEEAENIMKAIQLAVTGNDKEVRHDVNAYAVEPEVRHHPDSSDQG